MLESRRPMLSRDRMARVHVSTTCRRRSTPRGPQSSVPANPPYISDPENTNPRRLQSETIFSINPSCAMRKYYIEYGILNNFIGSALPCELPWRLCARIVDRRVDRRESGISRNIGCDVIGGP